MIGDNLLVNVRIGDQYYDFAKLLGGLEINYDLIKKNRFDYELNKENVKLKIPKEKTLKLNNMFREIFE